MSRYSDFVKTIQESFYPIYDNEIDNEIVLPQKKKNNEKLTLKQSGGCPGI